MPTPLAEQTARGSGRPRDESRDDSIRAAVVELLAEVGYGPLTIDAVAARARAGKATIYRRWSGKAELVADAIACQVSAAVPDQDTGSLRGDLLAMFGDVCRALQGPVGATALGLLSELHRSPELSDAFRTTFLSTRQAALRRVLDRGVARGEVRADADLELMSEIAPALLLHRRMISCEPFDTDLVARVVDSVLLPALHTHQNVEPGSPLNGPTTSGVIQPP